MQAAVKPDLWRRVFWVAAGIVVLLAASWLAVHIPRTIAIFVIAAFIAFGVGPIAQRLETRLPKPLAISLVFAGLIVLVAIGLIIVVPLTVEQTQLLVSNIPGYATAVQSWLSGIELSIQQHFPQLDLPSNGINVDKIGASQLSGLVSGTLTSVGSIAVNTATGFFIAFSAIILSFFFLLNDSQIAEGFASMFPPGKRETARKLAAEVTQVFGSYI
ncbi:MAG TPA: AI-2E family transporter, partial [Candidatus Baltobacteraceae bacterium]|nr:AI-2E family transporter [Candidatus Baltobacteraceae bacterium]